MFCKNCGFRFEIGKSDATLRLTYCKKECERADLGGRTYDEIEADILSKQSKAKASGLIEASMPDVIERDVDDDGRETVPA